MQDYQLPIIARLELHFYFFSALFYNLPLISVDRHPTSPMHVEWSPIFLFYLFILFIVGQINVSNKSLFYFPGGNPSAQFSLRLKPNSTDPMEWIRLVGLISNILSVE